MRPVAVARFQAEEVDDDLVLYDPLLDSRHVLNATAADVWWLCDGHRTCDEVVEQMAALYRRKVDEIEPDVRRILSELTAIKVISQT